MAYSLALPCFLRMYTPVPKGYYQTDHWKATRRRVLVYRNHTCAACGTYYGPTKAYLLDCHHTKKAYQKMPQEGFVRNERDPEGPDSQPVDLDHPGGNQAARDAASWYDPPGLPVIWTETRGSVFD
jgi:hypothetical protein